MANIEIPALIVRTALAAAIVVLPTGSSAEPAMASGQVLFQNHCASCHGTDGSGNGPAATGMAPPPPNLTEISKRAGGKFPAAHVVEVITYGGRLAAHGKGAMPIWGKIFSNEGGRGTSGAATSRRNMIALKRYLETIQK